MPIERPHLALSLLVCTLLFPTARPLAPGSVADPVRVTGAEPRSIRLASRQGVARATLVGSGLEVLEEARLVAGRGAASSARVELAAVDAPGVGEPSGRSLTRRPLLVRSDEALATGRYTLQVRTGRNWIDTPLVVTVPAPGPALRTPTDSSPPPDSVKVPLLAPAEFARRSADPSWNDVRPGSRRPQDHLSAVDLTATFPRERTNQLVPPKVDSYRPETSRTAFGGKLELKGTNLDAAHVKVRFDGTELAVLERSATRLVLQLPSGSQPRTGRLEIANGPLAVQPWHAIHEQYTLVPEEQLQPWVELESFGAGPVAPGGLPYEATRYNLRLTVHEVPGDVLEDFDTALLVPRPYSDQLAAPKEFEYHTFSFLVQKTELPRANPGSNLSHVHTWFWTRRSAGTKQSFHFAAVDADIPFASRPGYTIENTFELRTVLDFACVEAFGFTQGDMIGPAGTVKVGLQDVGGDLAFRIASAPLSTSAAWVSELVPLANGWTVSEMQWEETRTGPKGVKQKAKVCKSAEEAGFAGFVFDTDQFYCGWETLSSSSTARSPMSRFRPDAEGRDGKRYENPAPYNAFNRRYLRVLRVDLFAGASVSNDHTVTTRLKKVTLRGPHGGNWQDAFLTSIPQEEGLWYAGTVESCTDGP